MARLLKFNDNGYSGQSFWCLVYFKIHDSLDPESYFLGGVNFQGFSEVLRL